MNEPIKYINKYGKECYKNVTKDILMSDLEFHEVEMLDDFQFALHTNLGTLTVLDRMTGFGYRDVESGFLDEDKFFWLACGNCDVRESGAMTIQEAIDFVKKNANACKGE
jgi:hypothetical protein